MIVEHLMYACQGLSEPYIEYWGKDSDEKDYPDEYHSRVLELSEINKLIDERVKHPILPQTTRQKLIDSSVEYFGGEGWARCLAERERGLPFLIALILGVVLSGPKRIVTYVPTDLVTLAIAAPSRAASDPGPWDPRPERACGTP